MKDGSFSYLHLSNPNIATYIETWHNEPMPFDDIEPPQINNTKHNNGNFKNGGELPSSLDNDDEDPLHGTQVFGAGTNGGASTGRGRGLTGVGGSSGAAGVDVFARTQWMDLRLHEVFKDDIKRFQDLTILPSIEKKD
ncbi:Cta6 protein [Candida orthopsilosis Co 90-125]|uniref:Cta6 protein n=1 Tax=Candida orthopsilosis (strain 90-125) TaxID=1136231 RepID=H8WZA5_CANO9|nr:Cta6 protein [Candida orthopsilosis Co 90-125]CCG21773.1 Cta6 protein [Candida orthopsilosis Co 90-125]